MTNKIKAAIIGSSGYAGEELTRILANHSFVEIKYLTSKSYLGQNYSDIYQNFNKMKRTPILQVFLQFLIFLQKNHWLNLLDLHLDHLATKF